MSKKVLTSIIGLITVLLAACGGAAAPTATPSKPVNIRVESSPNPPAAGDIELVLAITDAGGRPIEGASVDVTATHVDMTGMDMSGPATDQGGGKYAIRANFSMSGSWELKVYVRKDGLDYSEEIDFPIR